MKTRIIAKENKGRIITYEVLEADEIGLIPRETVQALVCLEEDNLQPYRVHFFTTYTSSASERKYRRNRRLLGKENQRERTPEDLRKIAIRLESSVVD